ncbi:hypothetical protein Pfo_023162 [Paulownia fortunei]|nr:hypothetical protein Pfo_023162 [Paulownia fortunei]
MPTILKSIGFGSGVPIELPNAAFRPLGFPFFFFFRNLQFSTLIFPLLAQALDRKCMFLICNGILAFLAKNLKLTGTSSGLNYGEFMKITEDGVKQIQELPQILEGAAAVQENAASMEYFDSPLNVAVPEEKQTALQHEQDYDGSQKEAEEIKNGGLILESEDWEEEEEEEDLEESRGLEGTPLKEEVNDAGVSTEELNKKFEEFIRRMKEEIRIKARNTIIAV